MVRYGGGVIRSDAAEPTNDPGVVTIATGMPRPSRSGAAMEANRTRVIIAVCGVMAVLYAAGELFVGHGGVAATNFVAAGIQGLLFVGARRWPDRAELFARTCLVVVIATITTGALQDTGLLSSAVWYLAGVPLLAGALLQRRNVIAFTALSLVAVVAIALLTGPTAGNAAWQFGLKQSLLILAALVTGLTIQRLAREQLRSLEQREETIRSLIRGMGEKNRELSLARDAALQAARAKGDFLATMSHEIRTPLNAVIGLTGVLLDTPLDSEQKELTGTIRASGNALLTLINDILDFSKIEAGRLDLESSPFDVVLCAEDALELVASSAGEKQLVLSCQASIDVPARVLGDPGRVRQILLNLVSNAVKFTPRGRVHVQLGVERSGPEDEIVVHAAVSDTGVGISADRQAEIFEPFTQVDPSVTRKFGGTGLGLTICRRLAERMGGRIWVESTLGQGSTFHVTFAAREVEPPFAPPAAHWVGLVVVADPLLRSAVSSQLEMQGIGVQAFESLAGATAAPHDRADLLVVDAGLDVSALAGGDGEPADRVPVITLALAGAVKHGAPGELTAALAIPVRRSQLSAVVRRLLAREPPSESRRESGAPAAPHLSLRVLIVEDNSVNQRVAKLLVERAGHRADVVGDGAEAIVEVRRHGYDVVLMDAHMPEVDGMTATRRIREELPEDRQPVILALTADVSTEVRLSCVAAGMDGFLPKPIVEADLRRALLEVAQQPREARRGKAAASGAAGATAPQVSERDPDDASVLDPDQVTAMVDLGESSVFTSIVDDYCTQCAQLLSQMRDALDRRDGPSLKRAAHSLKGSSGMIGARRAMDHSLRMERAAVAGDFAAAETNLPVLQSCVEAACVALMARAAEQRAASKRGRGQTVF